MEIVMRTLALSGSLAKFANFGLFLLFRLFSNSVSEETMLVFRLNTLPTVVHANVANWMKLQ